MHLTRRTFLETLALAAASTATHAQTPASEWPSPVIDCHFHERKSPAANLAHLDGSGTTQAFLLTHIEPTLTDDVKLLQTTYPNRFPAYAAATDVAQPGAEKLLTDAIKSGAQAFAEIKSHVAADSPEMLRIYALAAELNVPIMMHFQEVTGVYPAAGPSTPVPTGFNTAFARFDSVLKAFPKTRFIGHANAFWANISADYKNTPQYPTGPIVPGGLTDRWLSDYPNLFGDLSANSGNNALSRDPAFTADFLKRHQDKLLFGSDCPCTDGHGAGATLAPRLAGQCLARATLTLLKQSTTPELFHKIAWVNGHHAYAIKT